jgi:hypothetical protein
MGRIKKFAKPPVETEDIDENKKPVKKGEVKMRFSDKEHKMGPFEVTVPKKKGRRKTAAKVVDVGKIKNKRELF